MATRRLARTGLDEKIVHGLSARNINTAKELLECSTLHVSELLDVSHEAADRVLKRVAHAVCPEPITVEQLLARRATEAHHLAFGLRPLDDALRGGAPAGCITELVGPAGAGKTQLCKQLCVSATLPVLLGGMAGGVIYIDTETKFSAARLVEIARARWPERFASDASVEALTRSVLLFTPATSSELLARLAELEQTIIERGAKLVIIDSIAALVRSEFGRESLAERQALLGAQAARLKALAEAFRIPIVVTNQVQGALRPQHGYGGGGRAQPAPHADPDAGAAGADAATHAALGTKWAHDANTRLALELAAGERLITIRKSPAAPALSFPYEVTAAGVMLVGDAREAGAPGVAGAALEDGGASFFSG